MTCSVCRKKIDTSNEEFEEIGSIEFAHVECVDKQESHGFKTEENEWQRAQQSKA